MVKLLVQLCLIANPYLCKEPVEVVPLYDYNITSPMACMMGGMIYGSYQDETYFAKIICKMDDSDNLSDYLTKKG